MKSLIIKNIGKVFILVGGTSGAESYGEIAKYKAEIINTFLIEKNI
ncbi:MAG: hypothetical protein ACRCTZ_00520 [Sarcina sp.]